MGSAVATHLFDSVGPVATAFLRLALGAVLLLAVWRPRLRSYSWPEYRVAILFGLVTAIMNASFYSALHRIPLGIAVTLEFVGPLSVAVVGSRRALDLLWVALAAAGIVLLTPWGGLHLDVLGVLLALLAGCCWALYIVLSARVGRAFSGGHGLAIAVTAGAIGLLPLAAASAGASLLDVRVFLIGMVVAVTSSVVPYSLEMEALRRLPTQVFGILMSTEPAVGALVGLVFLGQVLGIRAVIAIVLVTVASVGASQASSEGVPQP
jgi:inner membrane transporter RhtA